MLATEKYRFPRQSYHPSKGTLCVIAEAMTGPLFPRHLECRDALRPSSISNSSIRVGYRWLFKNNFVIRACKSAWMFLSMSSCSFVLGTSWASARGRRQGKRGPWKITHTQETHTQRHIHAFCHTRHAHTREHARSRTETHIYTQTHTWVYTDIQPHTHTRQTFLK